MVVNIFKKLVFLCFEWVYVMCLGACLTLSFVNIASFFFFFSTKDFKAMGLMVL